MYLPGRKNTKMLQNQNQMMCGMHRRKGGQVIQTVRAALRAALTVCIMCNARCRYSIGAISYYLAPLIFTVKMTSSLIMSLPRLSKKVSEP